ncbi:MAG: UPF0182 family protein [Syntrophobacterales bacterium]
MSRLWRWLKLLALAVVGLGVLYVVLAIVFLDFMVDLWWFESLGYLNYFFRLLTYRYLILISFSLAFFLIFFLNFWVASRFLGTSPPPADQPDMARYRYRYLLQKFRHGSIRFYALFSLILAVVLAWPFFQNWQETLLFLFGKSAGVTDPYYGIDVSFFLFSLPVYLSFLHTLLVTLILLFLGLVLLYYSEKQYLAKQARHLPRGAKLHLSVMVLFIFVVGIWDFFLQRYSLLYTTVHEAIFYGPGYVEMNVVLPLIWVCIVLLCVTAILLVFYINTRKGLKVLVISGAVFVLALGARYSSFLPDLVQHYVVKPNEISKERPYIANNIQATLAAFNLDQVECRDYKVMPLEESLKKPPLQTNLRNIPVWDQDVLLNVYQHLQELRTYYKFPAIDVGRYTVNGVYQQVFMAPRELSMADLPAGVKNWINERLKYTHGYGAVMTPAAQGGEEPMTWFIHDIPPQSHYGFKIAQPGIYFGKLNYGYVIAPNESRELDYPTAEGNVLSDYQGERGILVHSLFRRLLFALYYKESDILFTFKTTSKSRILIRRNIVERVKTLTPFFLLDKDPYIVITDKGIYWIQDAYTTSKYYPYSQPYEISKAKATGLPKVKPEVKEPSKPKVERLNYIRNSVKIVISAYDGTVDFYLADKRDPIVQAYNRMYPGLLKPLADMPPELKEHIRYPKDIFDIQVEVYAKYHQINPGVFFRQEDIWEFPEIMHDRQSERMRPYFLTLNLINQNKFEFILVSPMTPKARTNLRSLVVAGCDGENYGKIYAYEFPKGELVYGPSQVDAFIDQNTTIAQQFTLWNQLGSQVVRGKMILIPATGGVVYIQPVYLKAAAGTAIPQLQRLIMNKGEITVMEPSLEEDLASLEKSMWELSTRAKRRLEGGRTPEITPPTPGPTEAPGETPKVSEPE